LRFRLAFVAGSVLERRVVLDDVVHLFHEAPDPFSPDYEVSPALEFLASELYAKRALRSVRLTLELPGSQITPDVVRTTSEGIRRYCNRYVREVERTRISERWRNVAALAIGVVALAAAVVVNRALRSSSSFWSDFFSEGVTVAFWVAVWYPLDNLFFGQWQKRVDLRVYRALRDLDLEVVSSSTRAR
jgi:hypothetical protein